MKIRSIVKYHGGKGRLYPWLLSNFPPNYKVYVELFGGAASVLLNKKASDVEIYNEIDSKMFNLVNVIKNNFNEFIDKVKQIEYSEGNFLHYKSINYDELSFVDQAVCFYVLKRMSRGGMGKNFSWSSRQYSLGPAEVHCWLTSFDNVKKAHDRLQNVILLNSNALDVIGLYDGPDTFFYADPPYLASTRISTNVYNHEFSLDSHKLLSDKLNLIQGRCMLSGYESEEYNNWFYSWNKLFKMASNHSSQVQGSKELKKECIWLNY
jgi:DNA adenine methylase